MTLLECIHTLILGPLELLFDVIYALAYRFAKNPGLAVVALSLAVNILVLPLYRRADALQDEERARSQRMKPRIDQIREAFSGDERFMMLQTYYRQNNYKPYHALKGSLSLLLEIPFFIAAYNYLSGLSLLRGASFGPIADLGAPDTLLHIGGTVIHLLPILMTAINIVSGAIYTRGMPARSKIQLYGMALIFLMLLYESPSGLVLYWTLNNLFSLGKNICQAVFAKLKEKRAKGRQPRGEARGNKDDPDDFRRLLCPAGGADGGADSLRDHCRFPGRICGAFGFPFPAAVCAEIHAAGSGHVPDLDHDLLPAVRKKNAAGLQLCHGVCCAGGHRQLHVLRKGIREHFLPADL